MYPVKIHKIDKIERLKDRPIIPSVRFSAVGRVNIGFLLKDNSISYSFFERFFRTSLHFCVFNTGRRAEKFCIDNKIVLILDKNFLYRKDVKTA